MADTPAPPLSLMTLCSRLSALGLHEDCANHGWRCSGPGDPDHTDDARIAAAAAREWFAEWLRSDEIRAELATELDVNIVPVRMVTDALARALEGEGT